MNNDFTVSKDGWQKPLSFSVPMDDINEYNYSVTQEIEACRTGWLGVWDAIKNAVSKRPLLRVPQVIKISFTVQGNRVLQVTTTQENYKGE